MVGLDLDSPRPGQGLGGIGTGVAGNDSQLSQPVQADNDYTDSAFISIDGKDSAILSGLGLPSLAPECIEEAAAYQRVYILNPGADNRLKTVCAELHSLGVPIIKQIVAFKHAGLSYGTLGAFRDALGDDGLLKQYLELVLLGDDDDHLFIDLSASVEPGQKPAKDARTPWDNARSLFPRAPYPWDVWPSSLAAGFKQMGRAFATSPEPLPGAACAIVASLLGAMVNISPKSSWKEPLIFWFADIRPSGSGKTAAPRALCRALYEAQSKADEKYLTLHREWEAMPRKERGPEPERPRGYFMTGLTLEGIRADNSGHGGALAILDEISALISTQNEYKTGGSDREAWLCLYDGNPARIVRVNGTKTIANSRLSIFGGIQPGVWRKTFSAKDGIFLEDGTAFRLLLTYGGHAFYPQTAECWTENNRKRWDDLLGLAMQWADWQETEKTLCLSEEAQALFFDWRNTLFSHMPRLPNALRGFVPKTAGYALRLAGVLHCIRRFDNGEYPASILTTEDMERGIKAVMFHLGQTVDAACALVSREALCIADEITPQMKHLAGVLETLRDEVDNGHLAIGLIFEQYRKTCPAEISIKNAHTMGSLLRHAGFDIPDRKLNANGKRCVRVLRWDEKINLFLEKMSDLSDLSANQAIASFAGADIENEMSAMSALDTTDQTSCRHVQTSPAHSLHPETCMNKGLADKSDNADIFLGNKMKNDALEVSYVEL